MKGRNVLATLVCLCVYVHALGWTRACESPLQERMLALLAHTVSTFFVNIKNMPFDKYRRFGNDNRISKIYLIYKYT